jgi:hypothetical protein
MISTVSSCSKSPVSHARAFRQGLGAAGLRRPRRIAGHRPHGVLDRAHRDRPALRARGTRTTLCAARSARANAPFPPRSCGLRPADAENAPARGAFFVDAANAGVRCSFVSAYLTRMSLRTSATPFVLRARRSAVMRSSLDLAKPDSCTTPFSVSTLMAIALTVGSSANLAFTLRGHGGVVDVGAGGFLVALDGAAGRGDEGRGGDHGRDGETGDHGVLLRSRCG